MSDLIERQAAIRNLKRMATQAYIDKLNGSAETVINCCIDVIERQIPSAQPEIVRCKDCEYGEQDEVGRWFCSGLGCQIGDEDGSGFCADGERKADA